METKKIAIIQFAKAAAFPFILGLVIASVSIYLTPLKNYALIEPTINDIDPQVFYDEYVVHPEQYIFIDVRPAAAYNKLHAQGSKNVELFQMYNERHNLPKHGKTIILICSGGLASGVAYGYLEHFGFLNLRRITGGIENWQAEGLPVEIEPLF